MRDSSTDAASRSSDKSILLENVNSWIVGSSEITENTFDSIIDALESLTDPIDAENYNMIWLVIKTALTRFTKELSSEHVQNILEIIDRFAPDISDLTSSTIKAIEDN